MKLKNKTLKIIAILLFLPLICAGCSGARFETRSDYAMGTYIEQRAYGSSAERAMNEAKARLTELENRISWRIPGSDIARLNAKDGKDKVTVSADTLSALTLAREIAEATDGAFDPTIGPVSAAWGIGTDKQRVLTADELIKLLPLVDYHGLSLTDTHAQLLKGQAVDLGAIGKGMACDVMRKVYKDNGIESGLISVGGSITVIGKKTDEAAWVIGIRDPLGERNEYIATLGLSDLSVSTSGSYEKFFEKDGVRYHHILDARTGYPTDSGLLSVTIITQSGALADALSTACYIIGMDASIPLLKKYHAQAVFVTNEKKVYTTENLIELFTFNGSGRGYTLEEQSID